MNADEFEYLEKALNNENNESLMELTFDMMEGSKTGKAAEADLIIGIGKRDTGNPNEPMRQLNISKNKINGVHADIPCFINPQLSRYDV